MEAVNLHSMPRRWRLSDRVIVAVTLVVGANAVAAGGLMILVPDGSQLGLPPWTRGPFPSFLVPGLLLYLVVGGTLAAAGIATAWDRREAPLLTAGAGAILCGWIAVQVTMIGLTTVLQLACFACGVLLLALAAPRAVRFVSGT